MAKEERPFSLATRHSSLATDLLPQLAIIFSIWVVSNKAIAASSTAGYPRSVLKSNCASRSASNPTIDCVLDSPRLKGLGVVVFGAKNEWPECMRFPAL